MRLSEVKLGQAGRSSDARAHGPVQVIAVTGGKGGTGKTNIAVNLAHALVRGGRRTMLLDADLGMANVDVLLGLQPNKNLFDVISGRCALEDIIMPAADGLLVVPAASGVRELAQLDSRHCAGLIRAFSDLDSPLDTLVVDTATGISDCVASFCRAANEILVVVCNEPASIRDSVAQIEMLTGEFGVRRFRILANMVAGAREGKSVFRSIVARLADDHRQVLAYAGFIPRDGNLVQAIADHTS
ncbi:MAG: P-loop NTPase, partial [Thiohalobacterales bacterium]|nr:P-loop NTPase [Thiohalobacterales bacterium]